MKKRSKKSDTIRVCIKIPGRVQNVDKAIEMLGGEEALVKAITSVNSKVKVIKSHLRMAQNIKSENSLKVEEEHLENG